MTATAALYNFFNGFGISAYPVSNKEQHSFPYIVYDVPLSHLDEGETAATVNIWYKTESESIPNAKAKQISDAIGRGAVRLVCDEGYILLKRGSPWMQMLNDEADTSIKRRYINITAEFHT